MTHARTLDFAVCTKPFETGIFNPVQHEGFVFHHVIGNFNCDRVVQCVKGARYKEELNLEICGVSFFHSLPVRVCYLHLAEIMEKSRVHCIVEY